MILIVVCPLLFCANIFAAGGVRSLEDLLTLKQLGVAGALVASALHNGVITAQKLTHLNL